MRHWLICQHQVAGHENTLYEITEPMPNEFTRRKTICSCSATEPSYQLSKVFILGQP